VELDPGFAAAWSGLADSYTVRGYWGMAPPGDTMPKALTAARRAVTLDPNLAEAHSALALGLLLWERDYAASSLAFQRALELNPNYTQGRCWYGLFQLQWAEGRLAEGLAEARRALESDPLSAYATTIVAMTLFGSGPTGEALDMARRAVDMDSDSLLTHWVHGLAASAHGAFDEAIRHHGKRWSNGHLTVGWAAAAFARRPSRRSAAERQIRRREPHAHLDGLLAVVAEAVGGGLRAELVSQAVIADAPLFILQASTFPGFEQKCRDPRFAAIRGRMRRPRPG
jgi:tetratricopeptide (TPR) repeat protein